MDRVLSITKALTDGNRLRVVMALKNCGELNGSRLGGLCGFVSWWLNGY